MNAKKRVNGSWVDAPYYIHKTAADTFTTLPADIKADGSPITIWSMKGNGQQTRTPTHDNPVMPEFVGVRTANLFNSAVFELVPVSASAQRKGTNLGVLPQGTYTFNAVSATSATPIYRTIKNGSNYTFETISSLPYTFTADGVSEQIIRTSGTSGYTWTDVGYSNIMLNTGSTAKPYEPYGWAEKITCGGETTPVYLGEVPTVRRVRKLVLTGEETYPSDPSYSRFITVFPNAKIEGLRLTQVYCTHFISVHDGRPISEVPNNSIYSSDVAVDRFFIKTTDYTSVADFKSYLAAQYAAGTPVTVWYVLATPETGIVNEPLAKIGDYADELHSEDAGVTIPTVEGSNVLTVESELQPSEMTITYTGWHPSVVHERINGVWT